MQNDLISIITVCYNCENSIEETIKSVISQSYPSFEYIIVDGGSNDGTVDIIKKYEDKINIWISESDEGIYHAMNKAIKLASGKWINFMNSGDRFISNNCLKDVFNKSSYTDSIEIIYGNVILDRGSYLDKVKATSIKQLSYKMPFCHQSCFVKTELMREFQYDLKYKIAADYHFFYRVYFSRGTKAFFHIDSDISFCDATESFSRQNQYPLWIEYLKIRSANKDIRWFWDNFKNVIKISVGYKNRIK